MLHFFIELQPIQGKSIGTIGILSKNWQLTMWIKLLSGTQHWSNIFHATNTGSFESTKNGDIILALFQHHNNTQKINIHFTRFAVWTINAPWNTFIHLRLIQQVNFKDNKYYFSVYVNRTLSKKILIENPEEFQNTLVYVSNPVWKTSNAILKDVKFGNL